MHVFRRLIRLVETYSADNSYLLRYMKDKQFDPYAHWYEVCEWLEENDYLSDIDIPGEEINFADDLREHDPEVFYQLSEEIQAECAKDVLEDVMQHNPADAPTWAHMSLNRKRLLPRQTWLVHFTDDPDGIAYYGFTIGMDQMDKLGLTTWTKNTSFDKKHGGYNFAFQALSRYAENAQGSRKYGKHAVLFQNSGVDAEHFGDEEDQVMFWGKDVDHRNIVVLKRDRDDEHDWSVMGHTPHRTKAGRMEFWNETPLFSGDYEACVKWVIQNFTQYRRRLTRW